jgi:hypothetical protein
MERRTAYANRNYIRDGYVEHPNIHSQRHILAQAKNFCFSGAMFFYRVCILVVRVPAYRSKGPASISGSTRFSEK